MAGVNQWQKVKVRPSCPELTDHTAVSVGGQMLVYGGIKDGVLNSDVWAFQYGESTITQLCWEFYIISFYKIRQFDPFKISKQILNIESLTICVL